jgi:arylsulfatase A-like enzyme
MSEDLATRLQGKNLLFVFPDQLGAPWLGCYGNPDVHSPNIDRFAQQGMLFEWAYTASPLCTPFRGTLFTGRYPCQTGIVGNGMRIPCAETTLPELFSRSGYIPSYVGKWHLAGLPASNRWVPPEERAGFKQFIGWDCGHIDHWKGLVWEDDPARPIDMPGHETDALTDIACDRLEQLKDSRFCLFVSYQAPHAPCSPPRDFLKLYEEKELPLRPNVTDKDLRYGKPDWNYDPDIPTFVKEYCAEISHLDAAFGRLVSKLEELGLAENTIVVFTSDHGEMAGCHGHFGKGVMYEESIHVPLIVRYPGGPTGTTTEALFSSIDLFPTLLDLCDLAPAPTAEGMSYGPLIRGGEQGERKMVISQYRDLCLRGQSFKLVTDPGVRDPIALYDLASDPYELDNLVAHPDYVEILGELQNELTVWLNDAMSRLGDIKAASESSPAFS